MFDNHTCTPFDPDDFDPDDFDHGPASRLAILDDVNLAMQAIMDHVIVHDRRLEARLRHLEATIASHTQLLQEALSTPGGSSPPPSSLDNG